MDHCQLCVRRDCNILLLWHQGAALQEQCYILAKFHKYESMFVILISTTESDMERRKTHAAH